MLRLSVTLSLIGFAALPLSAQSTLPAPIVFFDIAGPDSVRLQKFYAEIFGWTAAPAGNFTVPISSPISSLFRQDPAEIVIYIGVADITATLDKVVAGGGRVEFPRLVVPGRVVLAMFKDPAGTRVGLVEMADGKPKVP